MTQLLCPFFPCNFPVPSKLEDEGENIPGQVVIRPRVARAVLQIPFSLINRPGVAGAVLQTPS